MPRNLPDPETSANLSHLKAIIDAQYKQEDSEPSGIDIGEDVCLSLNRDDYTVTIGSGAAEDAFDTEEEADAYIKILVFSDELKIKEARLETLRRFNRVGKSALKGFIADIVSQVDAAI